MLQTGKGRGNQTKPASTATIATLKHQRHQHYHHQRLLKTNTTNTCTGTTTAIITNTSTANATPLKIPTTPLRTTQALDILEERASSPDKSGDPSTSSRRATETRKTPPAGALSPELAARVSGLLLPSAVTLLEALVASSKLERAMEDEQEVVCQCIGQAVAQV